MAVDMFMKIDDLEGESQDGTHTKEIDVLAWSWGMSNSGTTHVGSGSGGGKANFQDLSFTKYIDASSASLQLHCANGKHFNKASLVVRKSGETPLEYVKIDMEKVLISSVSTGGSMGEDRLTENIVLNFGKITYIYTPQNESGTGDPEKKMVWDIAKNETA